MSLLHCLSLTLLCNAISCSQAAVLSAGTGLKGLSGIKNLDAGRGKRRKRALSEAELFELRQLVASGVKDIRDCPELLADEESDEEAAVALAKGAVVEQDFEVLLPR
jgi:hypothetical protein